MHLPTIPKMILPRVGQLRHVLVIDPSPGPAGSVCRLEPDQAWSCNATTSRWMASKDAPPILDGVPLKHLDEAPMLQKSARPCRTG